jgi:hypothetical protein
MIKAKKIFSIHYIYRDDSFCFKSLEFIDDRDAENHHGHFLKALCNSQGIRLIVG